MTRKLTCILVLATFFISCTKKEDIIEEANTILPAKQLAARPHENFASFQSYGSIDIGGEGAAEISTYDPFTKRLFVVNNTSGNNRIDVINFSDPSNMLVIGSIPISIYGGLVNSVSVGNGMLAAAIEASNKTDNGKVVVFRTTDYSEIKVVTVGALPDMITFSPDEKLIITANEGEPNANYTIDPVGSVSIISVKNNFEVATLDFASFAQQEQQLRAQGLRKFGPGATFAQDMEPEYVTVSKDSRTAWVTLQENNAIAKIDLRSGTITNLFPLGFKNYNLPMNAIDVNDGGGVVPGMWPVYGVFLPDAIAILESPNGQPYLFTANEGDAREYTGINPNTGTSFVENVRVSSSSVVLDPTQFPNATTLKLSQNMGRLNITRTMGDTDGDGDFDQLYSFGARSFSIWDGNTGSQLFDSGNDLDRRAVTATFYDDARSDDKSTEPEGLALGEINNRPLLFVGMERANAVAIYDVSDPLHPHFLQILATGTGPEGVLFISSKVSPVKQSLLVISSEVDGQVKVFRTSGF